VLIPDIAMSNSVATFQLLDDEQVIIGNQGVVCITTHRVRSQAARYGSLAIDEIFLEHLSYQAVRVSSNPSLLLIAALCVVIAGLMAMSSSSGEAFLSLVIAIACSVAYLLTRRHVFTMASSGGRIELETKSMSRETLDWFMYNVAMAKNKRIRSLTTKSATIP
jgi:hypothetical protein